MKAEMVFDGQTLTWTGVGLFKATTALPDYQEPKYQCLKNKGPVPEGNYRVLVSDQGIAKDDGAGFCNLSPASGLQTIPRGTDAGSCEKFWANWGFNRARLEPADNATRHACKPSRGGFYLHDSSKGYSHGCIEVEGRLFPLLKDIATKKKKRYITLRVKYVPGRITNGGTRE